MSLRVEVLEAAEHDLIDAARWYEEHTGRGEQVVAAVAATVERVSAVPGASALVAGVSGRGELRRALVPGFPYWLVFDVFDERMVVIALAHHSRDPTFWVSRL